MSRGFCSSFQSLKSALSVSFVVQREKKVKNFSLRGKEALRVINHPRNDTQLTFRMKYTERFSANFSVTQNGSGKSSKFTPNFPRNLPHQKITALLTTSKVCPKKQKTAPLKKPWCFFKNRLVVTSNQLGH